MTATDTTVATSPVSFDMSKHRNEVLIGIHGKKCSHRVTVMNTLEDFRRLSAALASSVLPAGIGCEATGNHYRPLAHQLGVAGFALMIVSSVVWPGALEALYKSWEKNDTKVAQAILHMLEIGAVQFFYDTLVVGTVEIQDLSKTHEIVSRSKTELWHRVLTHYLPLHFLAARAD